MPFRAGLTTRARDLRLRQTRAEGLLWWRLRDRRMSGWKFRRQVPVGPFVVDFLCHEVRLVIEVDGATHGEAGEVAYDQRRTRYLEGLGLKVLRVSNGEVFENLAGVCDMILVAGRK